MQPLRQWYSDLKNVVFSPRRFFTHIKTRGGFNEPLEFSLMTVGILAALIGVLTFSVVGFVLTLVVAFLFWTIFLFIQSAIYYIYLRIVQGHGTYETTFNVFAYLTPLTILSAWIGSTTGKNVLLAFGFVMIWAYVKYIEINALSYHHKVPLWKGAVAVLLFPILVGLLFLLSISLIGDIPLRDLIALYYQYSI